MQALIALPASDGSAGPDTRHALLQRPICGLPLICRVIATASRAGAKQVLLIGSREQVNAIEELSSRFLRPGSFKLTPVVSQETFDPDSSCAWKTLRVSLEADFLWIPWNWVTSVHALRGLLPLDGKPLTWEKPAYLISCAAACNPPRILIVPETPEGVSVVSKDAVSEAERFLVSRSGKQLDGIHSRFNRWLCRPAVRLLTHLGVTPNMVTLTGLLCAVGSAVCYARGAYLDSVLGALLFFLSGLLDEVDGMLARLKFADSAFGCWFEGFVDNATYLLVFLGVTLGLSSRGFADALPLGAMALVGCSISFVVIASQRRKTTRLDRPNEYLGNVYRLLEGDSQNWISKVVRQVHFLTKKGVLIHYVLIFTIAGWAPAMIWLVAIGSHATWIGALYLNHKFFQPARPATVLGAETKGGSQ
jgi:phosphatidylglycerophosphate synthase